MKTIKKKDIAKNLAAEMGISLEDAKHAVDFLIEDIRRHLVNGDRIVFRNFATLQAVTRAARVGTNPKKPDELYQIPPRKVVRFSTGNALHEALNPDEE